MSLDSDMATSFKITLKVKSQRSIGSIGVFCIVLFYITFVEEGQKRKEKHSMLNIHVNETQYNTKRASKLVISIKYLTP